MINPVVVNADVVTVPVKVGDALAAFKFNAVCVAVDIGLLNQLYY